MTENLDTLDLSPNAVEVMLRRIVPRDAAGVPQETPRECFWRVARTVAAADQVGSGPDAIEKKASAYFDLMATRKFMPNSPALVNAGRELGMMSACFVLPVPDTIEGIYEGVKHTAMIHKTGGGTGFSFSRLRPNGSYVGTTSGVASGPVSFMKVYDAGTEAIKQGGTRRGANMGILSIDHPDIMEFIKLKSVFGPDGRTSLENFNISVGVTNEFMTALTDNRKDVVWKSSGLTPVELWKEMSHSAWRTGDPGVVFLDTINAGKANPVPSLGPIEATNPCGEQPLYPYDSCNLGSLNLSRFVADGTFKWAELEAAISLAVQFLDGVITVNRYPLEQIANMTHAIRRIGLGVMGWADALIMLGLRYDSDEALALAETTMRFIQQSADSASSQLARQSFAFPLWEQSIYSPSRKLRNATRTTIAPTGTISIIAGCSSGIEPLFAPVFRRRHKIDRDDPDAWFEMFEINPLFKAALDAASIGPATQKMIIEDLADEKTTIRRLVETDVLGESFYLFLGANEIPYECHIAMQAAFQKYTDNGVSKTINLPESATPEDIAGAYHLAYTSGCTGVTVYRHNCRAVQVLGGSSSSATAPAHAATPPVSVHRRRLPAERNAVTHKFRIGEVEGYMTVGMFADGSPGEVFVNISKQGSTINGMFDTIAMLMSYALQYGVPLADIADKFEGLRFEPAGFTTNRSIPTATSVVDYMAKWLRIKFLDPVTPATDDTTESRDTPLKMSGEMCPLDGVILVRGEGCSHCPVCGYESC